MMQLHGTLTKYICLSSTLYTSLLVLGGKRYHVMWIKFDTLGGTSASRKTITTFYEYVQLDSGEPNTSGSLNTLSNSIPCVSNYPFIMGNQLTKKERN